VSAALRRAGIDSRRYWLLMDLFEVLSERGEMLDQLGSNGVALRGVTWMYAAFAGIMSIFMVVVARPALETYFSAFLTITAFLLLTILLSETGNSLVNPAEGLVLAHQPVDGATYTAAKLSHLGRIVLFLVPGINGFPALAGLMLDGAAWFYPILHLLAALAAGLMAALLCCALYGWLMRFVPAGRLKAAGQFAGTIPFLAIIWWQPLRGLLARADVLEWLPAESAARWVFGLACGAGAVAIMAFGIRSLSADYLIRVSSIMHGRSGGRATVRRSRTGEIVSRLFGGPAARGGFSYVCQMARRDFQFRRQAASMLVFSLMGLAPLIAGGWRIDPFSGNFSTAHLIPHLFGMALFFICSFLPYGNEPKAAWLFLLFPNQAFRGFARGIYAALAITMIVVPQVLLLLVLIVPWGIGRAGLFVAYTAAVSCVYLALELRLIDTVPFGRPLDPRIGATMLPAMIIGGMAMAIAVGVQHFFVFRSPATVSSVTAALALAGYFLTRRSLDALEGSIRYNLGLLSEESGTLYREIGV
jgi:hypothetical protein